MYILERVNQYTQDIKKTPYVYTIQRSGIEVFVNYIDSNHLDMDEERLTRSLISKMLLHWIPKNKKYLSEAEIYQIVYTIQDIYNYILEHRTAEEEKENKMPTILELYGQEYMRVYKARNMLLKLTKDPVIGVNPIVIDLNKYRSKKSQKSYSDIGTTYEQALFRVQECKEGGQVLLTKLNQNKVYKLLLEYPAYKYLREGDLIQATIKRKLFYVYWEIEELKSYYLPDAASFFM